MQEYLALWDIKAAEADSFILQANLLLGGKRQREKTWSRHK